MYKCEFCNLLVERNIPSHKVVVATRGKKYPSRLKAFKVKKPEGNHMKYKDINDSGGYGYETVQEKVACKDCAKKYSYSENENSEDIEMDFFE